MAVREKLYTVEEFWKIARLPENEDKRLELEDGVIVDMGASRPINTVTAGRVLTFLNNFVMLGDLGYVTGADGGFKLAPDQARQPDVGFVSKERASELPREFNFAPDLAVEVVSKDEDIFKKALEYLHAGTHMVWAVYPHEKIVYVMRLDDDGSLRSVPFGVDSMLGGGDVLPGFTLVVNDIFPK